MNTVLRGRSTLSPMRLNGHKAIVRKDLILDLRERVICLLKVIGALAIGASAIGSSAIGASAIGASAGSVIGICGTCSLLSQQILR